MFIEKTVFWISKAKGGVTLVLWKFSGLRQILDKVPTNEGLSYYKVAFLNNDTTDTTQGILTMSTSRHALQVGGHRFQPQM